MLGLSTPRVGSIVSGPNESVSTSVKGERYLWLDVERNKDEAEELPGLTIFEESDDV